MTIRSLTLLAGLSLLAASTVTLSRPSPEERLAKALEGRTAGEPVKCIRLSSIVSTKIIDRTAILYTMTGGTLYVNTPDFGANLLSWDDVLVTDTRTSELCDVDVVKLLDTNSRMQTGSVGLGKFVPYPKPERDASR